MRRCRFRAWRARRVSEEAIRRLVARHTLGPWFGFLGNARVPVLELNCALDQSLGLPVPATSR